MSARYKFPSITLDLNQNRLENIYEVLFFNVDMTGLLILKWVVFDASDVLKVQIYVMYLSGVVHAV